MTLNRWRIGARVTIGIVIPLLMLICVGWWSWIASNDVFREVSRVRDDRLHMMLLAQRLGKDLVEIQYFLTEVAINKAERKDDDIYSGASDFYKVFLGRLERYEAHYKQEGDLETVKSIGLLRAKVVHFYETGKRMANAFVNDRWEEGFQAKEEFDEAAEYFDFYLEPLLRRERERTVNAMADLVAEMAAMKQGVVLVVLAALAISGLVGWRLIRSLAPPILRMKEAMGTIGEGHLDHRVPVIGDDELSDMAKIFNRMAQELARTHAGLLAEQEKLRDYANQLEAQSQELERRVQERTRQLVHSERLATLGTLSAGIAHEINNPNAFILGNVQFLKQYWTLADPILQAHAHEESSGRLKSFTHEIAPTLDGILDGSQRISKIVKSLKGYAKGEVESEKVACRLLDPIQDAQTLLRHRLKKGVTLTLDVPEKILLHGDRQQISQIFVNLFNNAADAMEEFGQERGRIEVRAQEQDGQTQIWVKDSGPGIPEQVIHRIFDPFYTTKGKTKGTGLGLSIVHGIVQDHKGEIHVSSPPGGSTEFHLTFPTLTPGVEAAPTRQGVEQE